MQFEEKSDRVKLFDHHNSLNRDTCHVHVSHAHGSHAHGSQGHGNHSGHNGHGNHSGHKKEKQKKCKLLVMCLFVFIMFILELLIGLFAGSLALLSDAFHMLSDSVSLIVALMALKLSNKRANKTMSYGWNRAETIGGLMNGVVLVTVCVFIMFEGFERFLEPPEIKHPILVLIVGIVSLLFNTIGALLFMGHHDHGHSHGSPKKKRPNTSSTIFDNEVNHNTGDKADMNMNAIFLHIMGDALASLAVILSAVVVQFTNWSFKHYLDPIVSIFISLIILYNTLPLCRRACSILLQCTPDNIDTEGIIHDVSKVKGVLSAHHLHIWQLYQTKVIASIHVFVDVKFLSVEGIRNIHDAIKVIFHRSNVHSFTIQTEPFNIENRQSQCASRCDKGCSSKDWCCNR